MRDEFTVAAPMWPLKVMRRNTELRMTTTGLFDETQPKLYIRGISFVK